MSDPGPEQYNRDDLLSWQPLFSSVPELLGWRTNTGQRNSRENISTFGGHKHLFFFWQLDTRRRLELYGFKRRTATEQIFLNCQWKHQFYECNILLCPYLHYSGFFCFKFLLVNVNRRVIAKVRPTWSTFLAWPCLCPARRQGVFLDMVHH